MSAAAVVAVSFAAGSVPFSQIAARLTRNVDLRRVGSGTVSGTALYRVAGFGPLAVAGVCDIVKASLGPTLAGRDRPGLAAVAGAAAVTGHNWSPWLRGAGGRGLSPTMGALLPRYPEGTAVILGGLAAGRMARQTGLGSGLAAAAVVPVLARRHGRTAALTAAALVGPMFLKRALGNRRPARPAAGVYLRRLLFDNDGDDGDDRDHGGEGGSGGTAAGWGGRR